MFCILCSFVINSEIVLYSLRLLDILALRIEGERSQTRSTFHTTATSSIYARVLAKLKSRRSPRFR